MVSQQLSLANQLVDLVLTQKNTMGGVTIGFVGNRMLGEIYLTRLLS